MQNLEWHDLCGSTLSSRIFKLNLHGTHSDTKVCCSHHVVLELQLYLKQRAGISEQGI